MTFLEMKSTEKRHFVELIDPSEIWVISDCPHGNYLADLFKYKLSWLVKGKPYFVSNVGLGSPKIKRIEKAIIWCSDNGLVIVYRGRPHNLNEEKIWSPGSCPDGIYFAIWSGDEVRWDALDIKTCFTKARYWSRGVYPVTAIVQNGIVQVLDR